MLKKIVSIFLFIIIAIVVKAQTPVAMAVQPGLSYTENFADLSNWTFAFSPTTNGTFTAGSGASAWKGIDATTATPTIPNANRITVLSNFFQTPPSGAGGYSSGVYKGNQRMELLSTGTTDNSSSIAMDFFLNFTGINAGNLSFDWATLNNSTGNRNGSLKVYASIDGITFTEITAAQVLNFTNNIATSGSIVNVPLPTIFNNAATARLRFYYHNGTGGTTGSRPRLGIDNVKVTAVPTTPCATPTAQPTNFTLGTVINNAITFSFTPASPAPQNYLVVMSNNTALSSNPINLTTYNVGDNLGDGNVIALTNNNTITATGLNASTTYYFFIYSTNNSCTGGPLYLTTTPLIGNATTLAGALPCLVPPAQPTTLLFSNVSTSSITGSFTASINTNEYLVVRTTSPSFTGTLNNGTTYSGGNVLGNGSVVTRTAGTTFTANNLISGTTYYFFIFALNNQNCTSGPIYNSVAPLTGNTNTVALPVCTTPTAQPSNLLLNPTNNLVNGFFVEGTNADGYLIVRSTSSSLSIAPANNVTYIEGNILGNGTIIQNSIATSFVDIGLTPSTTYYYFVFARNGNCTGGPMYLATNSLNANTTTTATAALNYYYGNLHAHSSYSDGNQDNLGLIPSDNYTYAKNTLCMDFLGISEHNHATAGMSINNWVPGLNQAAAATTANFLALYGMEYGVISDGGHVLIYGTNQLIGWETNNYNLFVPKSDYIGTPQTTGVTGLFRAINNIGGNAFATFAHPSFSDFNNLSNIAYNATADSAVIGTAIASGVAFSTNTTYNDPPFSFGYIDYFNRMLSKGYHIGPLMDHDTHNTNFGRSSSNRLVVVAPTLTSTNFYTAMRNKNFYATEDCDTRVNFTLNNQLMGSILSGTNAPSIAAYAIDPTNPSFTPTIKLMFGIAGSNVVPVQIYSTTSNTLAYTDFALAAALEGYYYLDITIASKRTITSPIWYTKNTVVPLKILSFTAALNNNNKVVVNFTTIEEKNCDYFIIEKSFNGNSFFAMDSMRAKNTIYLNNYQALDNTPLEKISYYRLKQFDVDGKFSYSNIIAINPSAIHLNGGNVFPNPVRDIANLLINSSNSTKAAIIVTDITGRIVMHQQVNLVKGNQTILLNVSKLSVGNYQVSVIWNNQKVTQKLQKL